DNLKSIMFEIPLSSSCRVTITAKGPRIDDSGGFESQNFQSCTKLSNSLLLFSKFMKKGNITGCCDKKKRNFQFLPYPAISPIRCCAIVVRTHLIRIIYF